MFRYDSALPPARSSNHGEFRGHMGWDLSKHLNGFRGGKMSAECLGRNMKYVPRPHHL